MPRNKKHPARIALPNQHSNLLRVPTRPLILRRTHKILEQKPRRSLHALALNLPQPDLINNRGRQDRVVFAHLRVCVGVEVGDDLVACDAHADGAADGLAGDFARDHVWVAG